MSSGQLTKGQNVMLSRTRLAFRLVTTPHGGIDVSALLLDDRGRVRGEPDFVFYNQPTHPSGGVWLGSGPDGARVEMDLGTVETDVERVIVAASVDSGGIGRYARIELTVTDLDTDEQLHHIRVIGESNEAAMVLAEVYRRQGSWKLRAVSQGYDIGLAGLATDYGIVVDPPAAATQAPARARPAPAATRPAPPSAPAPGQPPPESWAAPSNPPSPPPLPSPPAAPPPPMPPAGVAPATAPSVGVSYVRPGRSSTSSRTLPTPPPTTPPPPTPPPPTPPPPTPPPPATAPSHPAGPVAPAARREPAAPAKPGGPPSLRLRGSREAAGPTALAAAADGWARTRQRCGADAQRTHRMMVDTLAAFAAARPDVDDVMKRLDDALKSAESAWRQRFAKEALPTTVGNSEPYNVGPDVQTPDEWITQVRRLVADLGSMQILLSSDSRKKYRFSRGREYSSVVGPLISVRAGVRQRAWDAMAADGPDRAAAAAMAVVRGWVPIPAPDFPIGPLTAPLTENSGLIRGFGPLWVMVGTAGPTAMSFRTTRPSTPDGDRRHSLVLPSVVRYPVVIDLDRSGGFVCQAPAIVESTVLGLLAALGPGQVRLDVFDPDRLGESASFLFGLGDAAEKVIGRKVRTTAKELAELLVEVEEHITLVTQKYLQGAYSTLTEYNHASGDVAEPYRLLVVYDYPSGFSRDDQYDKEQLERLGKILATGRRCGVFVLIVRSRPTPEAQRVIAVMPHVTWGLDPRVVVPGLGLDGATGRLFRVPDGRVDVSLDWSFDPIPALSPQVHQSLLTHIERGLRRAGDLQVTPDRVSDLARSGMERAVAKGTEDREPVVAAYEPATWWQGSSAEHVTAVVGRLGATDTARIRLDSQTASSVLIGGRPGSGKSVLLHSLIMSLVQQYGPDELDLYLIDFKEGVEFKQYATARLPQARVIAIESEREFGVAVLEKLADEIIERGKLFRADGSGEQANVGQYRRRTGRPMARIVLIIDEFQVLFDRDDKIGSRAAEMLERVLRTGRAFGVHVVLASQTIAGMPALGRHLPNLIPTRVVLQSAEADSRLLLSEENADARMLSRPGEAILNTAGGQKDANQRFQSTYWDPEDRAWVLEQLRRRADAEGRTAAPIVFEGSKGASVDEVEVQTFDLATTTATATAISLPLGLSMNLSGPVRADLRREPGTNLLMVIDEPGPLLVALVVLARAGVRTEVLDYGGTDEDGAARLAAAADAATTTVSRRREVRDRLTDLVAEIDERIQLHDYGSPPIVVVIHGLHRAREFDPNGEYDDASESGLLKRIGRDGPEVGVHLVVWIDKKASVDRRLSYDALREFGLRVCGPASREDSLALIDSDEAQGLHPGQAVFDDHDQGRHQRVRLFVSPDRQWSAHMTGSAP